MRNQSHRFIFTFVTSVVAAILSIVALKAGVLAFTSPDGNTLTTFSLFTTCRKSLVQGINQVNCTSLDIHDLAADCSPLVSRWDAARAFALLTSIFACLLAIVGFVRMVHHFRLASFMHKAFLGLNIVSFVVSVIAFPVVISIYTGTFCGVSYVTMPIFGIGNCGELISVSFGAILVTLFVECFYKPSAEDAAALEGSYQEGMEYNTYGTV